MNEEKLKLEGFFEELQTVSGNKYWVVDNPEDLIEHVSQLLQKQRAEFRKDLERVYQLNRKLTEEQGYITEGTTEEELTLIKAKYAK